MRRRPRWVARVGWVESGLGAVPAGNTSRTQGADWEGRRELGEEGGGPSLEAVRTPVCSKIGSPEPLPSAAGVVGARELGWLDPEESEWNPEGGSALWARL